MLPVEGGNGRSPAPSVPETYVSPPPEEGYLSWGELDPWDVARVLCNFPDDPKFTEFWEVFDPIFERDGGTVASLVDTLLKSDLKFTRKELAEFNGREGSIGSGSQWRDIVASSRRNRAEAAEAKGDYCKAQKTATQATVDVTGFFNPPPVGKFCAESFAKLVSKHCKGVREVFRNANGTATVSFVSLKTANAAVQKKDIKYLGSNLILVLAGSSNITKVILVMQGGTVTTEEVTAIMSKYGKVLSLSKGVYPGTQIGNRELHLMCHNLSGNILKFLPYPRSSLIVRIGPKPTGVPKATKQSVKVNEVPKNVSKVR